MADEPNNATETSFVDTNTDDLDAFNNLLEGRAKEKPEEQSAEEKKEAPKTAQSEDESNEPDGDEVDENEDQDDNEDDSDSDGDDKEKPKKPEKKVNSFQQRINELTAKAREAERKLAELESKQADPTPKAPAQVDKAVEPPSPEAKNADGTEKYPLGEFDPDYIRDLTRHTIQEEQKVYNERATQEKQQREFEEARAQIQNQWVEKLTSVTDKHEDFLDKTVQLESAFDGLDAGYSDYLVQTIKSLDNGPDVLYHLANDLTEAKRLVQMGPLGATLALGELNAKFKQVSEPAKKEPKITQAPPPAPTNKGNKTRISVTPDTDDLDAFSQMLFSKKPGRRS